MPRLVDTLVMLRQKSKEKKVSIKKFIEKNQIPYFELSRREKIQFILQNIDVFKMDDWSYSIDEYHSDLNGHIEENGEILEFNFNIEEKKQKDFLIWLRSIRDYVD